MLHVFIPSPLNLLFNFPLSQWQSHNSSLKTIQLFSFFIFYHCIPCCALVLLIFMFMFIWDILHTILCCLVIFSPANTLEARMSFRYQKIPAQDKDHLSASTLIHHPMFLSYLEEDIHYNHFHLLCKVYHLSFSTTFSSPRCPLISVPIMTLSHLSHFTTSPSPSTLHPTWLNLWQHVNSTQLSWFAEAYQCDVIILALLSSFTSTI